MAKSSSKLVLLFALLIVTTYLQMKTEARRVVTLRCNTDQDCDAQFPSCQGHNKCIYHICVCDGQLLSAKT
ncbi:hypothetical protein L6164_005834 [Bauhinia variegata]|uniref:Uncharacterized protein n=1 Tax=Bauhinia variegata TaxID=167791 RepID=A0ACB9PT04_BAUVA|nr:hypothetical protein L6164_005834 [Bauhinia variegata]